MFVLAYIDPAAGSIILQGLIGGIVAGMVALRFYWSRVKRFVIRRSNRKNGDSNEQS